MTLIDRLSKLDGPDNRIDVLVEVELFKPDGIYKSVRANAAGTKVIYTTACGQQETYWADHYTHTPEHRSKYIAILRAKEASKP